VFVAVSKGRRLWPIFALLRSGFKKQFLPSFGSQNVENLLGAFMAEFAVPLVVNRQTENNIANGQHCNRLRCHHEMDISQTEIRFAFSTGIGHHLPIGVQSDGEKAGCGSQSSQQSRTTTDIQQRRSPSDSTLD